jgi:SNF2 family DNA or RNA helicase
MLNPKDLKQYQLTSAKFILNTPRCALWCEMGLGKTVITLTALREIIRHNPDCRVLIIAPKLVCETVWEAEAKKWSHTNHLDIVHITGTPSQRIELLERNTRIQLISVNLTKWLSDYYMKKWPYDVVVLDESGGFKDSSSQRFKALKKVIVNSHRVIELTGTPAPNGLLNIWSQVFLLDLGERLGRTMHTYKLRHFDSDYMGYNWTLKEGHDDIIHDSVRDICMTLSAEDYLQMPRRIDNHIELPMKPSTRSLYDELKKELIVALNAEEEVIAASAASLVNKLRQICNGGVYHDPDKPAEVLHQCKLDALERIVDEAEGTPVLVGYNFKFDRDAILKKFKGRAETIEDSTTVERWNRGEIPVLITHPASSAHGLNLQKGSNIMVWFGLTWSLELYQQFNARLHRQGQTKPVIIHHLLMENTIEQLVMEALTNKHLTQKALLDAMKREFGTW